MFDHFPFVISRSFQSCLQGMIGILSSENLEIIVLCLGQIEIRSPKLTGLSSVTVSVLGCMQALSDEWKSDHKLPSWRPPSPDNPSPLCLQAILNPILVAKSCYCGRQLRTTMVAICPYWYHVMLQWLHMVGSTVCKPGLEVVGNSAKYITIL